jgi:hypothetical protein
VDAGFYGRAYDGAMARLLAALALLLPIAAGSQELSTEDARAVRAVIEAQLDAFQRDDADRAFSYAAPSIRATFGTAETFMEMVRTQYPAVYRPRSVAFEKPVISEGQVVQPVRFTDSDGHAWGALYPMWKDASGMWRVNGCYLTRIAGQQT